MLLSKPGAFSRHTRQWGKWVWIMAIAGSALSLGVWAKKVAVSRASVVGAAIIAGGVAGWVGLVGHHGGTAVYAFGTGTPRPLAAADLEVDDANARSFTDPRAAFFTNKVYPVLRQNCMACHGPGASASSGLDLTSMQSMLTGGSRGPAIVPGNAQGSLLYQASAWTHDELRMPLSLDRLSDDDLAVLREWINAGAVWTDPNESR